MANFDIIKTAIDANIKTNGNQAITGAMMNSVLKQMVDSTDAELTELESNFIENTESIPASLTIAKTRVNGVTVIEDTSGYSSQYCHNATSEVQRYRIFGKTTAWIAQALIYAYCDTEPIVGATVYWNKYASQANQVIDVEVTLEPSKWLFVQGYANDLQIRLCTTTNKLDNIQTNTQSISDLREDLTEFENKHSIAILEKPSLTVAKTRVNGVTIVNDTSGYSSQYCHNATNEVQRYHIHGKTTAWIAQALIYAYCDTEPIVGATVYGNKYASEVSQPIDIVVELQPNKWLFVQGYANDFQIEVYVNKDKLDYTYEYMRKSNVLFGKKYAACGDSFTEGDFSTLTDSNGLQGKNSPEYWDATEQSWKTYAWHIADRNGMKFYNDGKSGSMMGADYWEDGSIKRADAFAYSRYKNVPKDTDYLTLMFGLNETNRNAGTKDSTDITTLWGAYNVVLEYFLTNMPYMKIGIIIPDAWESEHHRNTIIEIAKYWGIPYLDLIGDASVPMGINGRLGIEVSPKAKSLRNSAFQMTAADSHPNPKAHLYRSTIIENFLRSL